MQTVIWRNELSFLTQHDLFFETVQKIVAHNAQVYFLHEEVEYKQLEYPGTDKELILANRAKWTWEKLNRTGFIADSSQPNGDKMYLGRDREASRDVQATMRIASIINQWRPGAWDGEDIYDMLESWSSITGFHSLFCPASFTETLSINIETDWPMLLTSCLEASDHEKHAMLFTFSLLAFGKPELLPKLVTLLSFAMTSELKDIGLPDNEEYDLSCGCDIDRTAVQEILDEHSLPDNSVQAEAPQQYDGIVEVDLGIDAELYRQQMVIMDALRDAWANGSLAMTVNQSLCRLDTDALLPLLQGRLTVWSKAAALKARCGEWQFELCKLRGTHASNNKVNSDSALTVNLFIRYYSQNSLYHIFHFPALNTRIDQ